MPSPVQQERRLVRAVAQRPAQREPGARLLEEQATREAVQERLEAKVARLAEPLMPGAELRGPLVHAVVRLEAQREPRAERRRPERLGP